MTPLGLLSRRFSLGVAALLCLLLAAGCATPRVHRLTDFRYLPKAADAEIDCFVGKLTRPYESIAIVDSERYGEKDNPSKAKMIENLKKRARRIGADAVQDIRLLPVQVRGIVADERVPIVGAWKRGRYDLYFLRGEAVKYVQEIGLPRAQHALAPATEPAEAEPSRPVRTPAAAVEELPETPSAAPAAVPATPEILRVPAIAVDDEQ
ncbi:hypothetical protein JW916_03105 [Candidatus Sumerlaeota bacterium]|nr:hypothetical protein [Candidatus Sumerlaeota bacterium]